MVNLMEKALDEIRRLPETEQEALAAWILEELASERRWNDLLAQPKSQDLLEQLADEALNEHKGHKTLPLDPDKL